ncbi:AAA family ATPase [Zhihengliuella salsuginis]|uniref:Nuclease SbcCD subunit C n=1 Tax=Zhihengliuella salsuginis TaxID=578222 RepID=A0ABQ3GFF6_9MICC|nr:AAA family ATPase [Zhihengliuella salsuginis]GHD04382.1 hypothetical protein GCM10008096_11640 [Zhihengliuella salsuginis]
MEIESIVVQANYCFGEQPLQLSDLKKVNFIFAPNGAGKSTISNILAQQPRDASERRDWDVAGTNLPIRVFNEAYRSRVLTERVNGIFTMGDNSKDINDQIDDLQSQLRGHIDDREAWRKSIGSNSSAEDANGLIGEIEDTRASVRDSIFSAHKKVNQTVISVVFKGYRHSKEAFFNEAQKRFNEMESLKSDTTWESIETRARSLSGDKESRTKLPNITTDSLISTDDVTEVANKSAHGGGGTFSQLIQHLKNEDWVSKGRDFIDEAQGMCPFCQNQAPADLEQELSEYFAGGFDAALERSINIESTAKEREAVLEEKISALELALSRDTEIDDDDFRSSISSLRSAVTLLMSRLRERRAHPTQPIEVADVNVSVAKLSKLIWDENENIEQHNRIVDNASGERRKLVDDGWATFLSGTTVSVELKKFKGFESRKKRVIADLQAKIVSSELDTEKANQKIISLRDSVSNTIEVAERINDLLRAMGFHRFSLSIAGESNGGYRIVREDGTQAFDSLSEGEKTFICFAYFWESLFGSEVASGVPEDVVAVIDDPISSLDSDALFMIAAYIRDAANKSILGNTNLRQLIVLTHNTQFHHEAAYTANRDAKERRFFRLVKDLTGVTTVRDDGSKSRIRGSYALLWHSVVEAARSDDESDLVRVGVFNIVRRILEGYFKTIGNIRDFERPNNLSATEARVVSQFHVWANSGSHTISDDIDQTIDVGRTKDFLKLFKYYFDVQNHGPHFDMMVAASEGADLLKPDQLFARS